MLKPALFLTALALSFPIFPSVASDEIGPQELKAMAVGVPTRLIEMGIATVGHVDLRQMVELFQELTFIGCYRPISQFEPAESIPDGFQRNRASGRYDSHGRVYVYIGEELQGLTVDSPELVLLVLHEALGAAGYPDLNYKLAVALSKLAREKEPRIRVAYQDVFDANFLAFEPMSVVRRRGGGGIGVGGGDLDGAALKFALVDRFDELVSHLSAELRERVLANRSAFLSEILMNVNVEVVSRGFFYPMFKVGGQRTVVIAREVWVHAHGDLLTKLLVGILEALVEDIANPNSEIGK